MKKLLLIVLVLLMILPTAALATPYTHDTIAYSIEFPEGWTVLSRETAGTLMQTGLEELDNDTLNSMLATVEQSDIVIALAPDFQTNINIIVNQSPKAAAEDYKQNEASIVQGLSSQIPNLEMLGEGQIHKLDNGSFFELAYQTDFAGQMQQFHQYYIHSDSHLYIVTLTLTGVELDAELTEQVMTMLESLKVA